MRSGKFFLTTVCLAILLSVHSHGEGLNPASRNARIAGSHSPVEVTVVDYDLGRPLASAAIARIQPDQNLPVPKVEPMQTDRFR